MMNCRADFNRNSINNFQNWAIGRLVLSLNDLSKVAEIK